MINLPYYNRSNGDYWNVLKFKYRYNTYVTNILNVNSINNIIHCRKYHFNEVFLISMSEPIWTKLKIELFFEKLVVSFSLLEEGSNLFFCRCTACYAAVCLNNSSLVHRNSLQVNGYTNY
jgi:hypothetical protein